MAAPAGAHRADHGDDGEVDLPPQGHHRLGQGPGLRDPPQGPRPALTSSTTASAPVAIFLLITELAIRGRDSTVAVTSRRAYSRPSPGASSADCAARARWCCATWRTKSSAPTEVRTPGMASSLSMVPRCAPGPGRTSWPPPPARGQHGGQDEGGLVPTPPVLCLSTTGTSTPGPRRRPLSARAMVRPASRPPPGPASRRPSARPPSGSLAPPGAGRPLPASAPPLRRGFSALVRDQIDGAQHLALRPRPFVLPGGLRRLPPGPPLPPLPPPSAPSAPSASSTATRRTRSVRVISPARRSPRRRPGLRPSLESRSATSSRGVSSVTVWLLNFSVMISPAVRATTFSSRRPASPPADGVDGDGHPEQAEVGGEVEVGVAGHQVGLGDQADHLPAAGHHRDPADVALHDQPGHVPHRGIGQHRRRLAVHQVGGGAGLRLALGRRRSELIAQYTGA